MSRHPITLTFNDASFEIRPLTLGQLEAIEAALLARHAGTAAQGKAFLIAALARDHADVDVEGIEATPAEIGEAITAIMKLGGFEVKPVAGAAT